MADFFRFPHTPHLAWLGPGLPRDDKVLSPAEARDFLAGEVTIEEKLDGANLGLSIDEGGHLQAQNRGNYLIAPLRGQFSRLAGWMQLHAWDLVPELGEGLILFGEWCAARHSIAYSELPDCFIAFDVFDRRSQRFWSTPKRDELAGRLGIPVVPLLARGRTNLAGVEALVRTAPSRFGARALEGVVVRRDGADFLESRAKLVHPAFVQSIGSHWRDRDIEWNTVAGL